MNPAAFTEVEQLYHKLLPLAPDERAAQLAAVSDAAVRGEVERLLRANAQAGDFLNTPAAADWNNTAPRTIGHYRLQRLLGKGGMGEVYLAEDTRLRRKVAVKLLPADLTRRADAVQRFEQEAHAASALNHPNILTIHEISQEGSAHYITTEFIDGQTLRERLKGERLSLAAALDIAVQVAAALAAAHEARIVHRDIKPENIMLRRDGIVKVLDFGLAKLTEQRREAIDSEAETLAKVSTGAGAVMGTPQYMSPEQARGQKLDARTDIFSLGVVLYELVTGRPPFDGVNALEVVSEILQKEPAPLRQHLPEVPRELEQIITKALSKDREQRYQTCKDLLIDLNDLKEEMAVAARLERLRQPDKPAPVTAQSPAATTAETTATPATTGAKIILGEVKRHKLGIGLTLAVIVLASVAAFLGFHRKPILTDKDTILLTEFDNRTGEAVFDGTLWQGLAVQLQQSPFLDLFSDQRIRATLRLMSRSPEERVTRELGLGICQRQGLKAYIAGTIAKFDHNYSLTLEALNGQTGDSLAIVQVEAEGKDQVLKALSWAATELREKLGESLSSIKNFDAPLEVTTSSLDALKEYALGRKEHTKGEFYKGMAFIRRALEMDPKFASAWLTLAAQHNNTGQPGLAAEYAAKAFALRDRASEIERARITISYYQFVTGELDKAIEALEALGRNYPRGDQGLNNLSLFYAQMGQTEKAVAAAQEAIPLQPNFALLPGNLASYLIRLNRYQEAGEVLHQALTQKLDNTIMRGHLYSLAFINGDAQALQEQIAWARGKPDEHRAVDWQVQTASFAGEWRRSLELLRRATDLALRADTKENASSYTANQALRAAWTGQSTQAVTLAEAALKIERNRPSLTSAALALVLAGDAAKAQPLIQELEQKYPKDTRVNQVWLPEIKAALELRKGNAQAALELLETARRFGPADEFWQKTLRIMAYLKLGKGAEASTEARKILDHRGEGPRSLLWPVAHLNLARAAALQGDTAQARQSYQDFFALWKDADADLPILLAAKQEYARLK